jgi:hypothetical protein
MIIKISELGVRPIQGTVLPCHYTEETEQNQGKPQMG